jgi:hypothetical protein
LAAVLPLYKGQDSRRRPRRQRRHACADHEIAKRIRHAAQLDPEKGEHVDDITYAKVDGPSMYSHPLCANTWRNGQKLGDEALPTTY